MSSSNKELKEVSAALTVGQCVQHLQDSSTSRNMDQYLYHEVRSAIRWKYSTRLLHHSPQNFRLTDFDISGDFEISMRI